MKLTLRLRRLWPFVTRREFEERWSEFCDSDAFLGQQVAEALGYLDYAELLRARHPAVIEQDGRLAAEAPAAAAPPTAAPRRGHLYLVPAHTATPPAATRGGSR